MNKYDIIQELARNKVVEQIIKQINRTEHHNDLQDLGQYIYLQLLEKDEDLISGLYERKELNFYLANMIYNQLRSKTSPYHRTYRLPRLLSVELTEKHIN